MNWQDLFSEKILDRGYDYFLDDSVSIEHKRDNMVKASVSGSEVYDVEIKLNASQNVVEMWCDCPYAAQGNNCKHMAAVLYELEENPDSGKAQSKSSSNEKPILEEIIESLTPDQLKAELFNVVSSDSQFAAQLIAQYATQYSADNAESNEKHWDEYAKAMQSLISDVIDQHSDGGFVDWRQGPDLVWALDREIFDELFDIVKSGQQIEVPFDLTMHFLDKFSRIDMDGSNGEHGDIGDSIEGLWIAIYSKAKDSYRNIIQERLFKYVEHATKSAWYFVDVAWNFLYDHFDANIVDEQKLALLEKELDRLQPEIKEMIARSSAKASREKLMTQKHSSVSESEITHLIIKRIKLMEALNRDPKTISEIKDTFYFLPEVREIEMSRLQDENRYEELIELLNESKVLDAQSWAKVAKYSWLLITCYEKLGENERAKQEAYEYLTNYNSGDVEGFRQYKKFCSSEEWDTERERIFKLFDDKRSHLLRQLYLEEGFYDRIMTSLVNEVENKKGLAARFMLHEIALFETVLRPEYDKELLRVYEKIVTEMARVSSGRKAYAEIVEVLRLMLDYDKGKKLVRSLVDEFRITYKKRPAMQDELDKLASN